MALHCLLHAGLLTTWWATMHSLARRSYIASWVWLGRQEWLRSRLSWRVEQREVSEERSVGWWGAL
jgi:hypothetical protein